jgi:hypothetical protein
MASSNVRNTNCGICSMSMSVGGEVPEHLQSGCGVGTDWLACGGGCGVNVGPDDCGGTAPPRAANSIRHIFNVHLFWRIKKKKTKPN